MNSKEMKKSTIIIALIIIIMIQIIARVYVGIKKEYFHIDEAYSYSLMNYNKIQITENNDFYENWHTKEYYIDYLAINEDEKWDLKPVYQNQKDDVHPPLYYALLRIACSFTINEFTKWTGIILNIIIWIFSAILIYLISEKIFKNTKMALLTCLITGLTLGALETTAFIRMYELTNMFVLLITYFHMRIYSKEEIKIKDIFPIGISILLGSLTHYYTIIYTAFIFLIFVIKYISKKQYKNLIKYVSCFAIAAAISILIFPPALRHIFSSYRGHEARGNLLNIQYIFSNLATYLEIISKNLFGPLAVYLIIAYIIFYIKKRKEIVNSENKEINLLLIPTILYFILVAQISSYNELRYIMPIISTAMICVIYALYNLLKHYFKQGKAQIIIGIILLIIIISPAVANTHLDFTYTKMNNLAKKMEEKANIPALYVFSDQSIRFLDDIYIFTKLDESYIMKYSLATIEHIHDVLEDKNTENGIIFIYNNGVEPEQIISEIKDTYNFKNVEDIQKLNEGMVKYIH